MLGNLAISRIPLLSRIPAATNRQSSWPSRPADRGHVEVFLKKDAHDLRRHTFWLGQDNLRKQWITLEDELPSSSLGLVYHSGPRSEDVSELLYDGFAGVPLPGAVAAIGCDYVLLANIAKLCRSQPRPYRTVTASKVCLPLELPPILMFVDEDDQSACTIIRAAEDIKTLDVPIEITVTSFIGGSRAALDDKISSFFMKHLTRAFPRMF